MGTDDLFADDPVMEPLGDGGTPVDQAKPVSDEAHPFEEDSTAKGKDGEVPVL